MPSRWSLRHARAVTARDEAILSAERTLATRFPEDYAAWLRSNEGLERDLGGSYLSLYSVEELAERNHSYAGSSNLTGHLADRS